MKERKSRASTDRSVRKQAAPGRAKAARPRARAGAQADPDLPIADEAHEASPPVDEAPSDVPVEAAAPRVPPRPASLELEIRVGLLEKQLQLLSQEFAHAVGSIAAAPDASPSTSPRGLEAKTRFDADSLSQFAVGFFPREYSAEGLPFRWTGAGPLCELRIFLDRSADREFVIDVGDTDLPILSALSGFVDYAPVTLSIENGPQGDLLTGPLPKRAYTRLAVITIALGKAPPAESEAEANPTWLGFRFFSMHVRAAHANRA